MAIAASGKDILAVFFDDGAYQTLGCGANGVTCAFGSAQGVLVYAVCQSGAAMTADGARAFAKTLELAAVTGNPVVTFYQSAGAKLEEGQQILRSGAQLAAAVAKISGVVPQIAVVTGVCGGASAMLAANADVCIMSEEGELFLTAPFTSAAKGDKLEDAGSAACAQRAGVAALVVKNADEAAKKAAQIVSLLPANNLEGASPFEPAAPAGRYQLAKYDAHDAVAALVDEGSAVELYEGFGSRVVTSLAAVNGASVGVVATQDAPLCAECTAKLARFVRLCDAFSIPVVTVINTPGFAKSSTQDTAGGLREAARVAGTYADATTAKIAVVTGKAVGPAYMALACADFVIAAEGCTIAPLEPKTAVTVLHKEEIENSANIDAETKRLAARYAAEECSAAAALRAGTADAAAAPAEVRGVLERALDMLSTKRLQRLPKKHGNLSL